MRPRRRAAKLGQTIPEGDPEGAWLLARLAPFVGRPQYRPARRSPSRRLSSTSARASLRRGRRCWCSRICTGQTPHCSRFSSTWPTGRRACRCYSSVQRGPSCTSGIRPSAATLRNAQRINLAPLSDPDTAELVSALLERQYSRPRRNECCWSSRQQSPPTPRSSCVCLAGPRPARSRKCRCRSLFSP